MKVESEKLKDSSAKNLRFYFVISKMNEPDIISSSVRFDYLRKEALELLEGN